MGSILLIASYTFLLALFLSTARRTRFLAIIQAYLVVAAGKTATSKYVPRYDMRVRNPLKSDWVSRFDFGSIRVKNLRQKASFVRLRGGEKGHCDLLVMPCVREIHGLFLASSSLDYM